MVGLRETTLCGYSMTAGGESKPQNTNGSPGNDEPFKSGGSGEIRTHGRLAPTTVFKTVALNHSATLPYNYLNPIRGMVKKLELKTTPSRKKDK